MRKSVTAWRKSSSGKVKFNKKGERRQSESTKPYNVRSTAQEIFPSTNRIRSLSLHLIITTGTQHLWWVHFSNDFRSHFFRYVFPSVTGWFKSTLYKITLDAAAAASRSTICYPLDYGGNFWIPCRRASDALPLDLVMRTQRPSQAKHPYCAQSITNRLLRQLWVICCQCAHGAVYGCI